MREWVLAEQTHAFIRSQKWQAAVLPFAVAFEGRRSRP